MSRWVYGFFDQWYLSLVEKISFIFRVVTFVLKNSVNALIFLIMNFVYTALFTLLLVQNNKVFVLVRLNKFPIAYDMAFWRFRAKVADEIDTTPIF